MNEVSQGASGAKEYVEFVVVGSPTCTTVPCFDLRGYYLDDNNGTFATGTGVGIANGCIRLNTNALWSCIPAGTIIVIYNDADLNVNMPANDLSMSDGNCRLIIPGNDATLLERHTTLPSTSSVVYPTAGFVTTSNWANVAAMANGGDSFQTRDPSGNLLSAVSWGTDNISTLIYFSGSQSGKVINNLNLSDNNPLNQANWATANIIAGNETPGAPNNTANAAWISAMNFSCGSLIPTALTASVTGTHTGCTCTGSATVTASGAIAPYTYSWMPSGGIGATASGLCAGNYSVTVTSANGCVQTVTVNIASVSTISASIASTNVSCHGNSNGSATVTPSGGTAPYTYTWSAGAGNNATASGLSSGNYSVTVTDANSCAVTATTSINQPPVLSTSFTLSAVSCNGGNNGSATIFPSGGTSPYTYTWSPTGGNNATITNLTQGTYSVHISDAHACTKDTQLVITEPPALTLSLTSMAETCEQANGTASAAASGGTGTLTYSWLPSGGNTGTAINLSGGIYTVTVTDALSCVLSNTITVQQFLSPVLSISTTSVLCNGGNTGSAASSVISGGTPAYTYTWEPTGGNNASAAGLSAGTYTLFITDAKGCRDTAYAVITQPTAINATLTSTAASCGNNNGTAVGTVSGGTGAYTYTWNPGNIHNATATGLAPGNYTLSVYDANACVYSSTVTVGNKPSPILSVTSTGATCFGASTGSASVTINAGTGTAPFTYNWSPISGTGSTIQNVPAGTYTVSVSDSVNCTATATVNMDQPLAALTAVTTSTAAACNQANGAANVSINGGTSPYTTVWSPTGGNNTTAVNLSGNITYTCVITDANTCTTTAQAMVTQNSSISLTMVSTPATCGLTNGTASVTATGGLPGQTGYTYAWSVIPLQTTALATNLPDNNIYTVTVSDSTGCTASKSIAVNNKPAPILSITSTSVSCNGASIGSSTVSINSGTGTAPFAYSWLPSGGNTSSISNLSAGMYTVSVSDSANCQATATVNINQPPALTITATSSLATCGNANGSASCNVTGGIGPYSYTWSPGGNNGSTLTNLAGNIVYTVTAQDANLCSVTTNTLVSKTPALTLTIASTQSVTCNGGNNGAISTNSSGSASTTYTWTPSGGNGVTASNLSASISGTAYTLSANDGGCKDSVTIVISEPAAITLTVNTATVCGGQVTTLAAAGANTYTWSTGSAINTTTVNPASTTVYTVSGQNNPSCPAVSKTTTVTVYPALTISVTPSNTIICQGNSTSLSASSSGGTGGITQYTWSQTGSSSSSITVSPTATLTTYTVSVYDAVCATTASTTAQVNAFINPPVNITATPSSGCVSICVSFTASVSNVIGNNVNFYHWDFGDGNTYSSSNNGAGHCYMNAGSYGITLSATTENNCVVNVIKPSLVNVYPNPTADFTASSFTTTINEGTIHFTDLSNANIAGWNWIIDSTKAFDQNPSHTFNHEGTYPVSLIVTDNHGCKDSTQKEIVVEPDFAFYAPNSFTPNGDGRNEVFLPLGTGWDNSMFNLWVFDRWGSMIMHSSNPNQGWNGTKNSEPVQEDVYIWKVALYDITGTPHEYTGQVSVIK